MVEPDDAVLMPLAVTAGQRLATSKLLGLRWCGRCCRPQGVIRKRRGCCCRWLHRWQWQVLIPFGKQPVAEM